MRGLVPLWPCKWSKYVAFKAVAVRLDSTSVPFGQLYYIDNLTIILVIHFQQLAT